ncbi:hypothetical protein AB0C06_16695 [Micromonospora inaquosa]|uniref:hypothetical protein n=1 Tax=Micromonospora inaquosa TaxID=2203716 RepID=UPI0034066755
MAWEWLGPVATGVVGIAGIAGSGWAAVAGQRSQVELVRHQLDGEAKRQHHAERQALFIRVMNELTALMNLAIRKRAREGGNADETLGDLPALNESYRQQIVVVRRMQAEVAVIAGPKIAEAFRQVPSCITKYVQKAADTRDMTTALDKLSEAMHRDLNPDNS